MIQGWYCKEKLEAGQSKGLKGYSFFFLDQTLISCHHSIIKGSPMVSLKKLSLEPCIVTFLPSWFFQGGHLKVYCFQSVNIKPEGSPPQYVHFPYSYSHQEKPAEIADTNSKQQHSDLFCSRHKLKASSTIVWFKYIIGFHVQNLRGCSCIL